MPELPLPVDIPWKLVDVSSGMMNTGFCDGDHPPEWRPSVAVFAYEPDQEQIPGRCGDRVCYLKVAVSVTGIQGPLNVDAQFDLESQIEFINDARSFNTMMLGRYLACYGVLLNVSVFPEDDDVPLSDYPHIVDFEPKNRELIQAVTESGEGLIGSSSKVGTDKSFQKVSGTEIGVSHTGKYTSPESQAGKFEASHTISGKWTNTNTETSSINTDASSERRERYSTQTTLTQMYNLLSGYHLGTNRATFLMLPRPHMVQPTRFRTFVHGIRQLEGVQEFLLVVVRPESMDSMRVEVALNTGHYLEQVSIPPPRTSYEERQIPMRVEVRVQGSGAVEGRTQIDTLSRVIPLEDGWEPDPTRGESGRGGVSTPSIFFSGGMHSSDLKQVEYHIAENQLFITYRIERGLNAGNDIMTMHFTIFLRRPRAFTGTGEEALGRGNFIGTRTRLCTGFTVQGGCIHRLDLPEPATPLQFVNERPVHFVSELANAPDEVFARQAPRQALQTLQTFMSDTSRQADNTDASGYMFTRAFAEDLTEKMMPREMLRKRAAEVAELSGRFQNLGTLTLQQFMINDIGRIAKRLGVEPSEIVSARVGLAVSMMKQSEFGETVPIEDGLRLVLPVDLIFGFDSADVSQDARTGLLSAARMIEAYPDSKVRVVGHTDGLGSAGYNKKLSERRANAVLEVLVSEYGISPNRLVAIGKGMSHPVAHNTNPDGSDNPEGRRANRRVDIEIVVSQPDHPLAKAHR